jgi:hypothetical protein
MRSWFALVLAPGAALVVQSAMYILVLPACASQSALRLHGSAAVALAITLGLALLARADWRSHYSEAAPPDDSSGDPRTARRFLAIVATAVASLSSLVIVAMWFGTWVLSPCDPWP